MTFDAPTLEALEALARVRVLASHRRVFQQMLEEAVQEACEVGVKRDDLADALGVHRATFYRQFISGKSEEDPHVQ